MKMFLFLLFISFLLSNIEAATRTYSINSGPQLTYWPNPYNPVPNGTQLFTTTLASTDTFAVQNRGTGSNSRKISRAGDQGDEPWNFVTSGGVLSSIDIVLKNQFFPADTFQVRISANPSFFFFTLTSSSAAPVVSAPSSYSANQCVSVSVTTASSGNVIKYQFYPSSISCTLYTSTGCVAGNAVAASYQNSDATTIRTFSAQCTTAPARVFVTFYEPSINSGLGYAVMNPPASYKFVSTQIANVCTNVSVLFLTTPSDSVTMSTVSNTHCNFYSDSSCATTSITGTAQPTSSSSFNAFMSCSVAGSESLNLVTSVTTTVSNTFTVLAVPVVVVDTANVIAGACAQTVTINSLTNTQSLSFSFVSPNSTCGIYSASGCAANTLITTYTATSSQALLYMSCNNPTDNNVIINVMTTAGSSSATASQTFAVKGLYLPTTQKYDVSSCFPLTIYGFNGVSTSLSSSNTDNCLFYLYNDCDLNVLGFNYPTVTPTSDNFVMYIKCAGGFNTQSLTVDSITTSSFPVFGLPAITLDPTIIKDQQCSQALTLNGLINNQNVSFSFLNSSCSIYSASGCAGINQINYYLHSSSISGQAQFYLLCGPAQMSETLVVHASAGDVSSSSFPIIGIETITNKIVNDCFTVKQYGVTAGSKFSSTSGSFGDCLVFGTAGCSGSPSAASPGGIYSENYVKCRSPMDSQIITTSDGVSTVSSNSFITFGAPTITIDVTTIIAGSCTSFTLGLVNTQIVSFSFSSTSTTCSVYTGTSVNCAPADVITQFTYNNANGVPTFNIKCDRPFNSQTLSLTPNLGLLATKMFTVIGVQPLAQTSYNTSQCFGVTINGFAAGTALSSSNGNCVFYGTNTCSGQSITTVATYTSEQIIYSKCTSFSSSQSLTVGSITTSPFVLFGTPGVQVTASTVVAGSCSSSVQLFGLIDTQSMTFSFNNNIDTTCNIYSGNSISCSPADIITTFTQSGSGNPSFKILCDRPTSSQRLSVAAVAGTGVSIFFPVTGIQATSIQANVGQCFNITTFGFASGTALSFVSNNGNCAFYGSNTCGGSAISTITSPTTQVVYGKCSNAVSNQQITVGASSTSLFSIFGTPGVQVTASTVVAGSCSSSVQLFGLIDTQSMTFSFDNNIDTTCNIYTGSSVSCGSADIITSFTQSGAGNPTFKIKCDRATSSQRLSVAATAGTGVSIFFPVTGIQATSVQANVGQCFNITTFGFASGTALGFVSSTGNCAFYGSNTCGGSAISTITAPTTQVVYGKCTTPVSNQQITVGASSTSLFTVFGVPTLAMSSSTISTNVCNSLTLGGLLNTQQVAFSLDTTFGGCQVYSQAGCAAPDAIVSYTHSSNSVTANLWLQCSSYSPSQTLTAAASAGSGTLSFVVFGQPVVATPTVLSTSVCSSGVSISGLVSSQSLTLSFSNTTMDCKVYSASGCNIADVITSYTHSISANNMQFWIQCTYSGVSQTLLASASAGTGTSNSFTVSGSPIVNVDENNVISAACSPTLTLNGLTNANLVTFTFSSASLGCKIYTTSSCSVPSAITTYSHTAASSSASFWMKCTSPGAQSVTATTIAGSSQQAFNVKGIVMGASVYIAGQCYPVNAYGTTAGDVLSSSNTGNCMLYESSSLCSGNPSLSFSSSSASIVMYMKCSGKASTQTISFGSVTSSSFSVQGIPFFDTSNLKGTIVQNTCTVVPVKNISLSQAFSISSTNSNCKFYSSLAQCNINNLAASLVNIISPVDGSLTTYIKCASPLSQQNLIISSTAGNFTSDPLIVSGIVGLSTIGQLDLNACSPPITISNVAVSQFISFASTSNLCSVYLGGSCTNSSGANITAPATSFSVQIKCTSYNLLQTITLGGTSSNSFIVGLQVTNVTLQSFVSAGTSQLVNVTLKNPVAADTSFSVSSSDNNTVSISSPLLFTAGSKSAMFMVTAANNISGYASIIVSTPSISSLSTNMEVRDLQIGLITPGNVTSNTAVYVIGRGFGNTAPAYMTATISNTTVAQGPNLKWMNDSYVILTLPPATLGVHNISLGYSANQTIQSNSYQIQYTSLLSFNGSSLANNIVVNYILVVLLLVLLIV